MALFLVILGGFRNSGREIQEKEMLKKKLILMNGEIHNNKDMGTLPVKVASVPSKVNHSGSKKVNEEPKHKKEAGTAGDEQKDGVGRVMVVEGLVESPTLTDLPRLVWLWPVC